MKVVQINATCGIGSTGKICLAISNLLTQQNIENYILYSTGNSDYDLGIKFSNSLYGKTQALKSRVLGNSGFNSHLSTYALLHYLNKIKPDIIHLHNIHSNDCNLEILFNYIKERHIKLFWTFHDCWSFTAYCPHFTMVNCNEWKHECSHCTQYKNASWFFDRSNAIYNRKKQLFSDLDLTIITPSQWLADLTKKSFFKDYPIKVIYNGIDLNIFKPVKSDFRLKHGIVDKFILLGVAMPWSKRKGIDVFMKLANVLDDQFKIVLVGVDEELRKELPPNVICINRTNNQMELSEIYSSADLFVNPTREEVLGMVNIESLACGTPVLTFRTGGCPEIVNKDCGAIVDCDDFDGLLKKIYEIKKINPFSESACLKRATEFEEYSLFMQYIELYKIN